MSKPRLEKIGPSVVYLVGSFPVLSQTFVISEIADHLSADLDVSVIAIHGDGAGPDAAAELPQSFRDRVTYLRLPLFGYRRLVRTMLMLARAIVWPPHRAGDRARVALRATRIIPNETLAFKAHAALLALRLGDSLSRFDVVHCHFGNIGRLGAVALEAFGSDAKLLVTMHGHDMTRQSFLPLDRFYRHLIRRADHFLPVNRLWRDRLIAAGSDDRRITVHHMGVDDAALSRVEPRSIRPAGKLHLAMIGRMVEKKGHRIALDALATLQRRRPDLELSLDLVGDGPLMAEIEQQITSNGLCSIVNQLGALNHEKVLNVVASADAFLLPSLTADDGDMEGIPVVLMEAMALRRPVISTRHSGIPELVEDEISGLLADEGDAVAIAAAIERIADDPALGERLANAGFARVQTEFSARVLGRRLRGLYGAISKQDRW